MKKIFNEVAPRNMSRASAFSYRCCELDLNLATPTIDVQDFVSVVQNTCGGSGLVYPRGGGARGSADVYTHPTLDLMRENIRVSKDEECISFKNH